LTRIVHEGTEHSEWMIRIRAVERSLMALKYAGTVRTESY